MNVKEIKERIKEQKGLNKYAFRSYLRQNDCSGLCKLKKKDLLYHLDRIVPFMKNELEKEEKMVPKIEEFECLICYQNKNKAVYMCFISQHKICYQCIQTCRKNNINKCPYCRQDRKQAHLVYCYENDRKNINKFHALTVLASTDLNIPSQQCGWFFIETERQGNWYSTTLITTRYKPFVQQSDEKIFI